MSIPESTFDRAPAPIARCTVCRVVFELPEDIWEKGYRDVRCGSCHAKFNLHAGIVAARLMVEEEDPSGDEALPAPEGWSESPDHEASTNLLVDEHQQVQVDVERYLYDDLEMDQTVTDFDLFSEEAGLPEVAFFERFDTASTAEADAAAEALLIDPEVAPAEAPTANEGDEPDSSAPSADTGSRGQVTLEKAAKPDDGMPPDFDASPRRVIADVPPEHPLVFDYARRGGDTEQEAEGDGEPSAGGQPAASLSSAPEPASSTETRDVLRDAAPSNTMPAKGRLALLPALVKGGLLGTVMLAVLGGLMVVMHQRPSFYNSGFWRPLVVASCQVFGCVVPSRVDLDQLVLVQRNVFSHPKIEDALVINVSFRNEAAFDQRYPVLVARFSDSLGRPMARRDFKPGDYLDDWRETDVIEAGSRLDINLEIDDPGEAADSFEFDFRPSGTF